MQKMPNAHWPDCSSEQLRQSVLFTNYVIKYNKLYNYSKHQIKINLFYNKTLFIILNIKICHNLQGVLGNIYIFLFHLMGYNLDTLTPKNLTTRKRLISYYRRIFTLSHF